MELQLLFKLEKKLTGPCLREAPVKIGDGWLVRNKEEKDGARFQISVLGGKQLEEKRSQGTPYFAPYPQILHFLEEIMANRKDSRNTREIISSTKIQQDKIVKNQEDDGEAMKKREKEAKKATSYRDRVCHIYPPACKKIYSYHL